MIPKIIHYCWFGNNELPVFAKKCIESWRHYLPDYEIKEWNESNFDVNRTSYTREAYRLKKYAFVSDYARMWILYNYGGVYFDTDVEVIKPMDDIIIRGPFMGLEAGHNEVNVAPGLGIGCYAKHSIYKKVLDWYENNHYATWTGQYSGNIVGIVTNILLEEGMKKDIQNNYYKCGDIFIYPSEFFCPMNYYTGVIQMTSNTRTIHHYSATWVNNNRSLFLKALNRLRFFYVRSFSGEKQL